MRLYAKIATSSGLSVAEPSALCRSRWNEARTLTAGNQCRADKQASVRSSFSDLPSHRCRIPDSGDAPDRLRPLPFHHQRSPSSSLVNIPQGTSHNPRTRKPCNSHRPQNRVVTQSRYIRSRRHARHVDIRDPPYGAIDSPVLRLHGRAQGVSDRPAPREPMTKPFLSRDFHLSDRTPLELLPQVQVAPENFETHYRSV